MKKLFILALMFGFPLYVGCAEPEAPSVDDNTTVEDVVDDTADDMEDAVDDAGDEIEEVTEDATDGAES